MSPKPYRDSIHNLDALITGANAAATGEGPSARRRPPGCSAATPDSERLERRMPVLWERATEGNGDAPS